MHQRALALSAALLLSACSGERLTGTAAQDAARRYQATATAAAPTPLFFLDGKKISATQARAIETKTISSIEVIKGAAAMPAYGDRAHDGVVLISSKAGAGPGPP